MSADETTITTEAFDKLTARRTVVPTDIAGASKQGARRKRNEDAWGFRGSVAFVVADGMGGRAGGDTAARAAVEALLGELCRDSIDWPTMIASVNEQVARVAVRRGFESVGAVAIGMRCRADRVTLVHVGDARAYRVRDGLVQQLTRDHSVAEAIAALGVRRSESGLQPRQLAAVTSYFGDASSSDEFSVHELTAYPGDRIILTSDGVHDWIDAEAWAAAAGKSSARDAAESLVGSAKSNGSGDDCTALIVDLDISDGTDSGVSMS